MKVWHDVCRCSLVVAFITQTVCITCPGQNTPWVPRFIRGSWEVSFPELLMARPPSQIACLFIHPSLTSSFLQAACLFIPPSLYPSGHLAVYHSFSPLSSTFPSFFLPTINLSCVHPLFQYFLTNPSVTTIESLLLTTSWYLPKLTPYSACLRTRWSILNCPNSKSPALILVLSP